MTSRVFGSVDAVSGDHRDLARGGRADRELLQKRESARRPAKRVRTRSDLHRANANCDGRARTASVGHQVPRPKLRIRSAAKSARAGSHRCHRSLTILARCSSATRGQRLPLKGEQKQSSYGKDGPGRSSRPTIRAAFRCLPTPGRYRKPLMSTARYRNTILCAVVCGACGSGIVP